MSHQDELMKLKRNCFVLSFTRISSEAVWDFRFDLQPTKGATENNKNHLTTQRFENIFEEIINLAGLISIGLSYS
jgi:hypothetical protein